MIPDTYLPYIPQIPLALFAILFLLWAFQTLSARKQQKKMEEWMKKRKTANTIKLTSPRLLTVPRLLVSILLLAAWAVMEKHFTPAWLGMSDESAAETAAEGAITISERSTSVNRRTPTTTDNAKAPSTPTDTSAQASTDRKPAPKPAPKPKPNTHSGDAFVAGTVEEIVTEEDGSIAGVRKAEEPPQPIYPTPQQCQLQDQYTRVRKVSTEIRSKKSQGEEWEQIPEKEGAYSISITDGAMKVLAHDEVGLFYAKQTISQLLKNVPNAKNAHRDPFPDKSIKDLTKLGELPLCEILDWPDIPFRGTVEGFYGAPWTHEARKSQFDFYGRNKMNCYIYAPKDDKYHHGDNCYVPYPADEAKKLADLVKYAHKNHVRFVWAIHPANTVRWNQNDGRTDLDRLCKKLEQMYDIGVRDFGVFVDDSSGEIGKASRQVTLCNYILENFIRKHKDVNPKLIMCPTGYNRAWANLDYIRELGKGLDKDILVMWTGDSVVHDITLSGQKWVNEQVQRLTFIWWNWPVNDYKRNRLIMGRVYGNGQEPEMRQAMSGFVSNPMEQSEASKVGLFSVADYAWNIVHFCSIPSWKEGIRRLYPESHAAMQAFCDHNSNLLPSFHGYNREESVDIAETANTFRASLAKSAPDPESSKATEAMAKEYARIEQAGEILLNAEDTEAVRQEAAPWFEKFHRLGAAGKHALTALTAKNMEERLQALMAASANINEMRGITRRNWAGGNINYLRDVEVCSKEMLPSLELALQVTSDNIRATITGKSLETLRPDFICQGGNPQRSPENLSDGNAQTAWQADGPPQPGDWYGYDFHEPIEIVNANMQLSGNDRLSMIQEAQFEISQNGQDWVPAGEPVNGSMLALNFEAKPLQARMIRYRITKPGGKTVSIAELEINRSGSPRALTNIPSMENLSATVTSDGISINRVMEVHNCKQNEYIELILATPITATSLEINLESSEIDQWATVQITTDDGKTTKAKCELADGTKLTCSGKAMPKKPIRSVRLTNTGKGARDIKINTFKVTANAKDPDCDVNSLSDGNIMTGYSCKEPVSARVRVPQGSKYMVILSDAQCAPQGLGRPSRHNGLSYYKLPGSAKEISIKAPKQPGKWIYEIIFTKNKPSD